MQITHATRKAQPFLGLHGIVAVEEMPEFFGRAFSAAAAELARQDVSPSGPPVALYRGDVSDKADVTAGFPVAAAVHSCGAVVAATLPGGPTVETVHVGSYDSMADTYGALMPAIAAEGLVPGEDMWEEYLSGPDTDPDPGTWRTRVVVPVTPGKVTPSGP